MLDTALDPTLWALARAAALSRDGSRCTVARLLGGVCHETLHVHHLVPVAEGGEKYEQDNLLTACASHHPRLEALRRAILAGRYDDEMRPRCPHRHVTEEGRRICERRLAARQNRRRQLTLA